MPCTRVGLLTSGSFAFRAFPSLKDSGNLRNLSPVTAAGPSLICTGFPFTPPCGSTQMNLSDTEMWHNCQREKCLVLKNSVNKNS